MKLDTIVEHALLWEKSLLEMKRRLSHPVPRVVAGLNSGASVLDRRLVEAERLPRLRCPIPCKIFQSFFARRFVASEEEF
jgi:hypothetical protein